MCAACFSRFPEDLQRRWMFRDGVEDFAAKVMDRALVFERSDGVFVVPFPCPEGDYANPADVRPGIEAGEWTPPDSWVDE